MPAVPGLYAWYAVLVVGPHDLDEGDEHDSAEPSRLAGVIAKHTERLRPRELRVTARGNLWAGWHGGLQDLSVNRLLDSLKPSAPRAKRSPEAMRWALAHRDRREVLAALLQQSAPSLSSPIYIGISDSLRRRLRDHLETFDSASAQQASGKMSTKLRGTFGGRAAAAGITRDHLQAAYVAVPGMDTMSPADLRKLAAAAEFVLNRWYRPVFGER